MDCTACSATSREALVSWDGGEEYAYTGRINDANRWNGFFAPAFTADEVRRMAKETEGVAGLYQISEINAGEFQIASHDAAADSSAGFSEVVAPTKCCGLYFIGDWWVWGEVEPELGDLPQNTSAHLTEL
jgi:hypothetical protein